MTKSLKETLKEIQILLGRPEKRLAGSIKYYQNLLNIPEDSSKDAANATKKGSMKTIKHKKITWIEIIDPTRGVISELAQKYPSYGLYFHKGYGTKVHQEAIARHKLSRIHRRSFNLAPYLNG